MKCWPSLFVVLGASAMLTASAVPSEPRKLGKWFSKVPKVKIGNPCKELKYPVLNRAQANVTKYTCVASTEKHEKREICGKVENSIYSTCTGQHSIERAVICTIRLSHLSCHLFLFVFYFLLF